MVHYTHKRMKPAIHIAHSRIPYIEITIVLRGELCYYIDGRKTLVSEGEAIYIPKGSVRARDGASEASDYVSFNFLLDGEIGLPRIVSGAASHDVMLLLTTLDAITTSPYYNAGDKIEHILATIISILEDKVRSESISPLTRQIIAYIHDNIGRKITLADIGRLTYFSPIYCDAVFKRECGKSIIDYLIERRIEEAKRLIMERTASLSDIAEAVGFSDYNYFSRIFKRRSGYSPSQYRKMITTGEV